MRRGCLIAIGLALAVAAAVAALLGPTLVREGRRFYEPIWKMKATQDGFEKWTSDNPWKEPAEPQLDERQLDRFLGLRQKLQKLDQEIEDGAASLQKGPKPGLRDVSQLMEGVGGVVVERMQAFVGAGMTQDEYHYVERLVYRKWLGALRGQGADPAARLRAAAEIDEAAGTERDKAVATGLRRVAQALRDKRPAAPDGVPEEVHLLLLGRAREVEAVSETKMFPMPRAR